MAVVKVSYGRCKRVTFNNNKNQHKLVAGRLYYISDTGEILRANDNSHYESYSSQIHVVDEFPSAVNDYIEEHIYIRKATGRAKIRQGNVIYEVQCVGTGGSSPSFLELEAIVLQHEDQLTWKTPEEGEEETEE